MRRQVTLARESTVADLTNVWPFPGVTASVDRQGRSLRERFRTLIALVRFLSRVHPPVHPQVLRIGETFTADVAHVGFFAGMNPPVLLQMLGAAETLAAIITEVKLRRIVALLVPEERPLRSEDATTNITRGTGHFVGLQFGMHAPAVRRELSPQVEGVVAELTDKRLLARMDVVMLLEIELLAETLLAFVAVEGQIRLVHVPRHVDAQSCQDSRLVVALLAHVTR